jgi:hypothetical protein
MSLFTEYLASQSAQVAQTEVAVAKAKAEQEEALKALELVQQKAESDAKALENAGLLADYQELVQVEQAIKLDAEAAEAEVATYVAMKDEAIYAASLIEQKAQAIEHLVTEMETQGLLADQIEETKKNHLDSAMSSHLAAKAAKERVARLLANKKIK